MANAVASATASDVLLFNSLFQYDSDAELLALLKGRKRRANVLMILVSEGGIADVAYKVARCLQRSYESYTIFVHGYCKSAGTLCVLGAHGVVMSDSAELGPLDVQIAKRDELGERSSGLVAGEALAALQTQAFEMYEEYFLRILQRSGNAVTFRTASEIASQLTVGLFGPLYAQINPVEVGEMARSMRVANDYGKRLGARSANLTAQALELLCQTYPSHGFVIDADEAKSVFVNVRHPTPDEMALAECLGSDAHTPVEGSDIRFLNDPLPLTTEKADHDKQSRPDVSGEPATVAAHEGANGIFFAPGSEGSVGAQTAG